jgi:hypothetical protein
MFMNEPALFNLAELCPKLKNVFLEDVWLPENFLTTLALNKPVLEELRLRNCRFCQMAA